MNSECLKSEKSRRLIRAHKITVRKTKIDETVFHRVQPERAQVID